MEDIYWMWQNLPARKSAQGRSARAKRKGSYHTKKLKEFSTTPMYVYSIHDIHIWILQRSVPCDFSWDWWSRHRIPRTRLYGKSYFLGHTNGSLGVSNLLASWVITILLVGSLGVVCWMFCLNDFLFDLAILTYFLSPKKRKLRKSLAEVLGGSSQDS